MSAPINKMDKIKVWQETKTYYSSQPYQRRIVFDDEVE